MCCESMPSPVPPMVISWIMCHAELHGEGPVGLQSNSLSELGLLKDTMLIACSSCTNPRALRIHEARSHECRKKDGAWHGELVSSENNTEITKKQWE